MALPSLRSRCSRLRSSMRPATDSAPANGSTANTHGRACVQLQRQAGQADDDGRADETAQQPGELERALPEHRRFPGAGDAQRDAGDAPPRAVPARSNGAARGVAPQPVEGGGRHDGSQVDGHDSAGVATLPARPFGGRLRERDVRGALRGERDLDVSCDAAVVPAQFRGHTSRFSL